jgi:phosphoribosylglycinamide formyltransferase-1
VSTSTAHRKKLALLISGSGSNLQAFIDAAQQQTLMADIAVVISNRPDVKGLERARTANIPTEVIDHSHFPSRNEFDCALMSCIDRYPVDAVVLAGFMRVLGREFVQHYQGKLFNIHPSLLPHYPGLHTHQRALEAGDKEAGATVHFVVPELDAGSIVIQARVPVCTDDTADSLARRVLEQEHRIYPLALQWFCSGRLQLAPEGAMLDHCLLPASGIDFSSILTGQ